MKGVLIGAGFFAQFQAEAWKRLERRGGIPAAQSSALGDRDVALPAVADVAPGRAQEFAAKYGIERAYVSVEAMLDAEKPDFVDIATRPDTHLELTRLAAARGIHVICQKPMSPTMVDNITMCDVCDAAGVRLLIHENWRWQPWYRKAKRVIDSGVLGKIKHLSFDWRTGDGNGSEPFAAQPYFRDMPRLIIHESLVHILDTFRYLAGDLSVTACETRRINPVVRGDDWAEIKCAFEGGVTGFIHGDRQSGPHPAPVAMGEMRIEGELGTWTVAPDGTAASVPPGLFLQGGRDAAPPSLGYKGDSVLATQEHLLDCLSTGQPCESEGREYLKTAQLVEDCYHLAGGAASLPPSHNSNGGKDAAPPNLS